MAKIKRGRDLGHVRFLLAGKLTHLRNFHWMTLQRNCLLEEHRSTRWLLCWSSLGSIQLSLEKHKCHVIFILKYAMSMNVQTTLSLIKLT